MRFRALISAAATAGVAVGGPAADLSFERDIRPILKAHCFHCHGEGGKDPRGGIDLRLRRFLVEGGDSGPSVVPGKPGESLLLELVRGGKMPKGEKRLSPDEVSALETWIVQGAKTLRPEPETVGPGPLFTEEDRSHWAFQPVRRPPVPSVGSGRDRVRTPVDAFLLAGLQREGLCFSADADKRTLARRAYFDLTGIPPTPAEVAAYMADGRLDAYERLIDRLLASPNYGERWGRHWLDVAGYADSEGYNEADTARDDAWRYRDYVIRAFNDDKPFDLFIQEQLAGDEMVRPPYKNLSPDQIEKLTATGFLRMVPDGTGTKNDDQDLARNSVVAETIKVVSSAFLGVTVGCAECHDHRYDPVPQRDYYRLRAIFEPALDWKHWREPSKRRISLLSDDQLKRFFAAGAQAAAVEAELKVKLREYQAWVFERELAQVPLELRDRARSAGLAWQADPAMPTSDQAKLLEDYPSLKVEASVTRLNLFLEKYGKGEELRRVVLDTQEKGDAIRAGAPRQEFVRALTETPGEVPVTYLFNRGDRTSPGEPVPPGDLTVLSPDRPFDIPPKDPSLPTTGRRLAFARHLTDGTHPLTARVLVNRVWMHHFGRGLVGTPADFGMQGERPTHPELLDWLADEFVSPSPEGGAAARGWGLKRLHKLIMTSTAYRQTAAQNAAGVRADVGNRLYWRAPVRRLEAEAVRDAVLAVSGRLNLTMYGPPVPVSPDQNGQFVVGVSTAPSKKNGTKSPAVRATQSDATEGAECRRSVYVKSRRSTPAYALSVFDAPHMDPNCGVRTASTVATQSLLLMNSQFIIDQSRYFALRLRREAGPDPAAQLRLAWRLAYGTELEGGQIPGLLGYLESQAAAFGRPAAASTAGSDADAVGPELEVLSCLCQVLLCSNRFLYVD